MPAWSIEIANELVAAGSRAGRTFDQIQLQKLVYVAHGWCLAMTGEPLTGDRPEAWDVGPMYRRLAEALRSKGRNPILQAIRIPLPFAPTWGHQIRNEMEELELDLIRRVSRQYGRLSPSQLAVLTRGDTTPWSIVYNSGRGRFREISHALIRDQFVQFAQRVATVEIVDSAAHVLHQTIVVDRTSEAERHYCDAVAEVDNSGRSSTACSEGLRHRPAEFVVYIGGLAAALWAATLVFSTLRSPLNALAVSGLATLILQSTIRAAGQIARLSEPTK